MRLNSRGQACLEDIQRVFTELGDVTERRRDHPTRRLLKLVAVEVVAERCLMPRFADFKASHPDIAIEFETDHRAVDPDRRDFDVWIAFTDEVADTLHSEMLFDETLLPVL